MKRIAFLTAVLFVMTLFASCGTLEIVGPENIPTEGTEPLVESRPTVVVTLPEGMTIEMMADTLQNSGVCDADSFLDTVQNGDFDDYDFVQAIPTDVREKCAYYLEGYLFPDTYEFYVDSEPYDVVCKLLDTFASKTEQEVGDAVGSSEMTLHELMVMASIIQKEAGFSEDFPRVSRVIWNRLERSSEFPWLQMDSTISYVNMLRGEFDKQELGGVYNTYRINGMPVGGICNPGLAAIKAALYPSTEEAIVNCVYFASIIETGETRFFETYAAHAAWCREHNIGIYGD